MVVRKQGACRLKIGRCALWPLACGFASQHHSRHNKRVTRQVNRDRYHWACDRGCEVSGSICDVGEHDEKADHVFKRMKAENMARKVAGGWDDFWSSSQDLKLLSSLFVDL
jgi:hypothetical protein